MFEPLFDSLNQIIYRVRQERPLILNITNAVTMDVVANGLLSLGASPIMSQAHQEIEELVTMASAVVINLGTLTDEFIALAMQACHTANALNKPIIFDPVGAGASVYRTRTCQRLLNDTDVAIVRGNASEIMALAGGEARTKGVDSMMHTDDAFLKAQQLAHHQNCTVVMSGPVDMIIDAHHDIQIDRGAPLMPRVTGTGCLLSAVVAAFHAVHTDRFEAAYYASLFYAVCGEQAAKDATGPGSFRVHFIDSLSAIPLRGDYEHN